MVIIPFLYLTMSDFFWSDFSICCFLVCFNYEFSFLATLSEAIFAFFQALLGTGNSLTSSCQLPSTLPWILYWGFLDYSGLTVWIWAVKLMETDLQLRIWRKHFSPATQSWNSTGNVFLLSLGWGGCGSVSTSFSEATAVGQHFHRWSLLWHSLTWRVFGFTFCSWYPGRSWGEVKFISFDFKTKSDSGDLLIILKSCFHLTFGLWIFLSSFVIHWNILK